jgi:hypothetical protein
MLMEHDLSESRFPLFPIMLLANEFLDWQRTAYEAPRQETIF